MISPPPQLGHFDPSAREVLLDEVLFDALLATHRGAQGHPSRTGRLEGLQDRLRDLGVLIGSSAHPAIRDGLTAMVDASCELTQRVSSPHFCECTRAWLLGPVTGLAHYAQLVRLTVVPTDLLPDQIADQLRVGPRGEAPAEAPLRITRRVIDALLAGQEENRVAAATLIAQRLDPQLGAIAADLRAGRWHTWHAELTWIGLDKRREGRALIAIDTPSGYLVASPIDGGQIEVAPITPEQIWRRILRLMPPAEVLAARVVR